MRFKSKQQNALQRRGAVVEKLNIDFKKDPQGSSENQGGELAEFKDLRDLTIEYRPPESLRPSPQNSRIHTPRQVRQIAKSMRQFGFVIPILCDGDGRIIAGHGRWLAAKLLGLRRVPTVRIDHLNEAQIRALMIADNRLTEVASWNPEMLAAEFKYLIEVEFDLGVTAFETE